MTVGGRQTVLTGESQKSGWAGYTRSEATGHRQLNWAVRRTRPRHRGRTRRFLPVATVIGSIGQVTLTDGAFDRLSETFGGPRCHLCQKSPRMTSAMNLRMSAPLRNGSGSALAPRAESDLLHTWRPHHRSFGRAGRMRRCVCRRGRGQSRGLDLAGLHLLSGAAMPQRGSNARRAALAGPRPSTRKPRARIEP